MTPYEVALGVCLKLVTAGVAAANTCEVLDCNDEHTQCLPGFDATSGQHEATFTIAGTKKEKGSVIYSSYPDAYSDVIKMCVKADMPGADLFCASTPLTGVGKLRVSIIAPKSKLSLRQRGKLLALLLNGFFIVESVQTAP